MLTKIQVRTIYFLGIGGIGMSALARYFVAKGFSVHGYDRTPTALTAGLETEGMKIHYQEDISLIPKEIELVIYTPAVPKNNIEFQFLERRGIAMLKRAEVLGRLSSEYKTIACAGTHGKTTVSTLVSHLLHESHVGCQAFLGGISRNFDSNLLLSETSPFLVAEADEFDRSFLQLKPSIAIITSIDADHLDIYGSSDSLVKAFTDFSGKIVPGGRLIMKKGLPLPLDLAPGVACLTYSAGEEADFYASNIRLFNGLYRFDFHHPEGTIENLELGIPGLYNVENAVAALAAAWLCGVGHAELRLGSATFRGVKRRFDIRLKTSGLVYIDDYAHHPKELEACIGSARAMFPHKKLTGIFQPHLFTRTRDFATGFAEALSLLDEIILLPIYPARELPIPGIDSKMLLSLIQNENKSLVSIDKLPEYLNNKHIEVLLTMGAGDIDTLVEPIEKYLKGI